MRIKGWMGRADQTTKVKGMFVRPEQIAELARRHGEIGRLRLVVPDGVSVVVSGHLVLGRKRGGTPPPASSDTPLIEVKGLVLGGEIIVRTPPRSRRFRLFGSRR